jgi:hypothetical protein
MGSSNFTVSIHLPSYLIKEGQITHLAEEFYGRQMDAASGGDTDIVEYGFEDTAGASGKKNGEAFRRTLDECFLKRKP